jgi:hypothetical protein
MAAMPLARIARLLAAQGNIRISKSGMNLFGQSSAASPKARPSWTPAHSSKVFTARIPIREFYPLEREKGIDGQLRRLRRSAHRASRRGSGCRCLDGHSRNLATDKRAVPGKETRQAWPSVGEGPLTPLTTSKPRGKIGERAAARFAFATDCVVGEPRTKAQPDSAHAPVTILQSWAWTKFVVVVKWSGLFYDIRDNGPHEGTPPPILNDPGRPHATASPDGLGLRAPPSRKDHSLPRHQ